MGCQRFSNLVRRLILVVTTITVAAFYLPLHAYEVVDSFGKHQFDAPPQRVVVTDWTLLEQLLELDILPVGAPELRAYQALVRNPPLPKDIIDIGLRRSPRISTIKSIKPDLIILGTDQKEFDRPFSRIARVMYYQNFSERFSSNGEKAKQRFLQLATLFQKTELAKAKLQLLEDTLNQHAARLQQHFGPHNMPPATVVRFTSNDTVLVYGSHSMPGYVLHRLGLSSEIPVEKNQLGERQVSIASLQAIKTGYLLYWKSIDNQQSIFHRAEWQALPAVKANRAIPLDAAWSYGGAMSLMYNADNISEAMLKK